jgi:hypothetical protein
MVNNQYYRSNLEFPRQSFQINIVTGFKRQRPLTATSERYNEKTRRAAHLNQTTDEEDTHGYYNSAIIDNTRSKINFSSINVSCTSV